MISHLEQGSSFAELERKFQAQAELLRLARKIKAERDLLAANASETIIAIVGHAVRMLAELYNGRDPGLFMLH